MGRAPCCEKMGLKRGPWTPEEDHLLVSYIEKQGHGNWRALPKHAGLLRCGKSCRLRWTNYLRPDIKRGNFTKEEEEAIFKLHEMLGNRWSTIASKLPGRTDNEIKNVWHTHLKKKLKQDPTNQDPKPHLIKSDFKSKPRSKSKSKLKSESESKNLPVPDELENLYNAPPLSPQPSSSDLSDSTSTDVGATAEMVPVVDVKPEYTTDSWETLPQTNDPLWSDVLPMDFNMDELVFSNIKTDSEVQFPTSSLSTQSSMDDSSIDFWYDLLSKSSELPDLPDF
ncbi:hypothetical protein ACHQM5_027207 [Ranunculus cassubicifolius]